MELGHITSVPDCPCRYDFVLDTGKNLYKIQSKTCNCDEFEEKITFSTCSSHYIKGQHVHTDYKNDNIDYFCTFYNNKCYLIPVEECGKTEKNLRLVPTRNGQVKNIAFAKDYIAEEVLKDK
jgi:hypothetical protein